MTGTELVDKLNSVAGKHGVGQVDLVENRVVGMKSRGVYETPGGTVLYVAHRRLESLTLDRETTHYKELVANKYAELVYSGLWFTPLRRALDAFVDSTQEFVTGTVKVKLFKGNCTPASAASPYSLYLEDLASFEMLHALLFENQVDGIFRSSGEKGVRQRGPISCHNNRLRARHQQQIAEAPTRVCQPGPSTG